MNHIFNTNVNTNYKQLIINDVKQRDIKYLLHFTPASNLANIFHNGLLPRTTLENNQNDFIFNDTIRIDGHPDSLSISISFPNYKMFYKYRTAPNAPDMAVLVLNPELISEKDCAFYYENAAKGDFNKTSALPYKNIDSWREMFTENFKGKIRSSLGISNFYTTNPQAEILVFDKIEPKYIMGTLFENSTIMEKYKQYLPESSNSQVQDWVFKPRLDYEQWP